MTRKFGDVTLARGLTIICATLEVLIEIKANRPIKMLRASMQNLLQDCGPTCIDPGYSTGSGRASCTVASGPESREPAKLASRSILSESCEKIRNDFSLLAIYSEIVRTMYEQFL